MEKRAVVGIALTLMGKLTVTDSEEMFGSSMSLVAAPIKEPNEHPTMSVPRTPRVTIFSSIASIAETLQKAAPWLPLDCVHDPEALSGYGGTVIFAAHKLSTESRRILGETEVLITEPAVLAAILRDESSLAQLQTLPRLQWCQSTYAGVDPLFRLLEDRQTAQDVSLLLPTFTLTRFAGKFGPPIAEWCLARIIGHERKFAASASDEHIQGWAASRQVTGYRYLSDLTLTILGGCGDIGSCIGRAAQSFGMKVVAYSRTSRESPGAGWDEVSTDLTYALQQADYIVSVLPSTPATRDILSGNTLQAAAREQGGKTPVFLNVGRGDVLSEESLVKALDRHYLAAAILDVFPVEPLPTDSPLWKRTDVVISPHVSGVTRAADVPSLFLENYERYQKGRDPHFVVDWQKGY
jgi:phosphoglycerate dehydrogenase-like enzyme